jgi:alkylation response protein AidB-like acyl-CoA dehydrogenase
MVSHTEPGMRLIARPPGWAEPLVEASRKAGEDTSTALGLAQEFGRMLPEPGRGDTATRWAILAAAGRENLTVGRVLEAHSDALAILAEAGEPVPAGTWGVFAAEAAPYRLEARECGGQVVLHGVKPWCSLAGQLDAALITAQRWP